MGLFKKLFGKEDLFEKQLIKDTRVITDIVYDVTSELKIDKESPLTKDSLNSLIEGIKNDERIENEYLVRPIRKSRAIKRIILRFETFVSLGKGYEIYPGTVADQLSRYTEAARFGPHATGDNQEENMREYEFFAKYQLNDDGIKIVQDIVKKKFTNLGDMDAKIEKNALLILTDTID